MSTLTDDEICNLLQNVERCYIRMISELVIGMQPC